MAALLQKKVFLAGRAFVPAGESTILHDIAVTKLLKAAKLDVAAVRTDETPDEFGFRVLEQIMDADALLPIVACLIIPAEVAPERVGLLRRWAESLGILRPTVRAIGWTPEVQAATVAFLSALDEPADKAKIYQLVAELLFPFLKAGLAPLLRSPGSSAAAAATPAPTPPSADVTTAPGAG